MSFLDDVTSKFNRVGAKDAFRAHAWSEFNRLGLPARRDEAWKYTNLEAVLLKPWEGKALAEGIAKRVHELRDQWRAEFDVLVIHNGQVNLGESVLTEATKACLVSAEPELPPANFEDGFTGLNAALSRTTLHLRVPAGRLLERPLLVLRSQSGDRSWISSMSRIELAKGSGLVLAEVFVGDGEYLRGELSFAQVGDGARLDWTRGQFEDETATHFAEVRAELGTCAVLNMTQVNAGAKWSRATMRVDINGPHGEARVQGLTFGRGVQHLDQRILVRHRAGQGTSAQLFKGVLRDRARGVLNGKIHIDRDAQKVDSSQINHNLLIGKGAEADTKPELEVYADDVKANHGASIGRLDNDKMFYLESRGIKPAEAERMLAEAFVGDVVMKVENTKLRALVGALVKGSLE